MNAPNVGSHMCETFRTTTYTRRESVSKIVWECSFKRNMLRQKHATSNIPHTWLGAWSMSFVQHVAPHRTHILVTVSETWMEVGHCPRASGTQLAWKRNRDRFHISIAWKKKIYILLVWRLEGRFRSRTRVPIPRSRKLSRRHSWRLHCPRRASLASHCSLQE